MSLEVYKITRPTNLVVIGGGYVGLPLAVAAAEADMRVTIVDTSSAKVEAINGGHSPTVDVTDRRLRDVLENKRCLAATTEFDPVAKADVVVICVPTPLRKTKDPDVSYIKSALEQMAPHVQPGQLVILESTTYPGYTREQVLPVVQQAVHTRVCDGNFDRPLPKPGRDFFVAFSPERVDPGNQTHTIESTPKVVGGITPSCTALAAAFYQRFIEKVHRVDGTDTAETVKLFENSFRATNIALANELSMMCRKLGVDTHAVVDAAKTKPFGFMPFYPGPGVGGHCFPGTEWVPARIGDTVRLLTFEELFEAAQSEKLQVLSANQWRNVSIVTRRLFSGDLYAFKTGYGHEVTGTDKHPMLVATPQGQKTVFAEDVQKGALLPFGPTTVRPEGYKEPKVSSLLGCLPQRLLDKTRVGVLGGWGPWRRKIYESTSSASKYDWLNRSNGLPWGVYKTLCDAHVFGLQEGKLTLHTGKGNSSQAVPAQIPLTEAVLRMLGYYIAEGCITHEKKATCVRWTFGPSKLEALDDLCETLNGLGIRWSHHRQDNSYHIKVSSELFAWWLEHELCCGKDCYEKRLPKWGLNLSHDGLQALLSGLFRGDGSYRAEGGRTNISYWSASERLTLEIGLALQFMGIHASYHRKGNQVGLGLHIFGDDALDRMPNLLSTQRMLRLQEEQAAKTKSHRKSQVLQPCMPEHCKLVSAELKTIEKRLVKDLPVYSLETEPEHVFQAGSGILVHNCIKPDPHYLSWRLRGVGYRARFIDLADAINEAMPEEVFKLVTQALNDLHKPLYGSQIHVLGVTYKPDVSDTRESPALAVMAKLAAAGANLTYEDPHVPALAVVTAGEAVSYHPVAEYPDSPQLLSYSLRRQGVVDCILVLTDHTDFKTRARKLIKLAKAVVDARGLFRGISTGDVSKYYSL